MKTYLDTPTIGTPEHDLLASAHRPEKPHNWEQGVAFIQEPIAGSAASGRVIIQGVTTKSAALTQNASYMGIEYEPFLVEVGVNRHQGYAPSDREEIARRVLERTQRRIIEQRMLLGTPGVPTNMFLADPATTTEVTGSWNAPQSIAVIQEQFATAGGHGTIYISPRVAQQMQDLLTEEDGKLYTKVRHDLVIVGTYGLNGPWPKVNAPSTGSSWVYGHLGEPYLLLSDEPIITDAFDQATNQPTVRAEKVAAVVWNPGQWATLADIDNGS